MRVLILVLLPFRRIFRRLELEKHWWHRLSLVVFFTALLSAFLAVATLSYLTLAPQVQTMPDIWQTVNSGNVQSLKPGDPIPPDAIPPPPDGSAVVEPEQSKTVPIPRGAQIDESVASANLPPGFVLDNVSGEKTIQMPDGTTATFPGSMSDSAIKAHWMHAKHHQIFRAILVAGLIALGGTAILSYMLQVLYRALLYVIFGAKPEIAPDLT